MHPLNERRAAPGFLELHGEPAAARPDARRVQPRELTSLLLRWQTGARCDGLPCLDEAALRAQLECFAAECVDRSGRLTWNEAQQRRWRAVCDALVASALAQPRFVVHGEGLVLQRLQGADGAAGLAGPDAMCGPVLWDLCSLLCDPALATDEAQQLDGAVRWWQEARHAEAMQGHPMAADFGECWRAFEWTMLLRTLGRIGRTCRDAAETGAPMPQERLAPLFQDVTRIALRYAPLAPLLTLLAPLSGQMLADGFTF